jgi:hypothetical protein
MGLSLVALVLKGAPFLILDYENYYPKGKKEVPKGDGSNKSESKRKFPSCFTCLCRGG